VKPPDFDYVAPDRLEDVIDALASVDDASIIAGGQSLVPMLNFRLARPSLLVDLRRIPHLDGIKEDGAFVRIGAMTTQRRAEHDAMLAERCPLVKEALRYVGHPQIRARGTFGGSIAHADPAAELPAMLLTIGGTVGVLSRGGRRTISADSFFHGALTTALTPDEVIVDLELPTAPPRTGVACVEVARRAGDYALCAAMAQVTLSEDHQIEAASITAFGIADRPLRLMPAEKALIGQSAHALVVDELAASVQDLPGSDQTGDDRRYGRRVAAVVAGRALTLAVQRAT
jgi:carbon-monoxide dehydrogenase medium subunit